MTKQITLEELLELVTVKQDRNGSWHIVDVKGDVKNNVGGNVFAHVGGNVGDVDGNVYGNVNGHVYGYVGGDVCGNVKGNVEGDVCSTVCGTINGKEWQFVETSKDKFKRLLKETGNQELIEAFNQQEDN